MTSTAHPTHRLAAPLDPMTPAPMPPQARPPSVVALHASNPKQAELLLYGPIGDLFWEDGVTAASVIAQLSTVTAPLIHVRINSNGGVVSDGLAIYNALTAHPATIHVTIDGVAASIASLIAQAGTTRRVYPNSLMMIHGPQTGGWGFAEDLRDTAAMLDTMAAAMHTAYTSGATHPEAIRRMLSDGHDHWLTAQDMIAVGLADTIIDLAPQHTPAATPDATATAAALLSYLQAIATHPQDAITAALRHHIQATVTPSAFACLCSPQQHALITHIEDPTMKHHLNVILAQAGTTPPPSLTPPALSPQTGHTPSPSQGNTPPQSPAPGSAANDDPLTALEARNARIRDVFAAFADVPGVHDLEASCLANPRLSVEHAQAQLLQRLPGGAGPLAATPRHGIHHLHLVHDEHTTRRQRVADGILARAGILTGPEADAARQDNPAAHEALWVLAEQSLKATGVDTRGLDREKVSKTALAQSTGDFPVILENVMHKMLLTAYRLQSYTWMRFCATGSLSDYRPHHRYHMGGFSDLKKVNENGEYENGVLSDAEKETIQAVRKGRILQITPEVLVNDDLGAFSRPTSRLAQAAARTIEKDVYALLALNAGSGPRMSDGKPLFHADHRNIPVAAALSVESIDAARQLMAQQMDVGGNDFLDIVPALWLGPLSLGSKARELNAQEYNDEAGKQQRKPNVVRGLFSDVVDSPRLKENAWYTFADPTLEPVIEVAFLNGVHTPTLEQDTNFRTDGLSWKVVHRYGVAAVGWRGATRTSGT
ncbi:ClpP-like prohead protease/major capsid protein fusion protein [Xylella fastidiosa]|uniref:ClpP-like prohead protease/major capsid protein fusion protein n=1 Tax=Xylella fastidiosa TaxID=2371 RepID=UPI00090A9C30|nr:ClpP-like prohead protease/major capsid protein fusion protein [Xylella fastidiosa]ALR01237.1 peptidase S14 [Xylella fastidiosa]ALR02368.1 peptidase S14 [Xylella fastidiosa]ALR02556.1 peptidase S14 [Xylella fastidiosa]